MQGKDKRIPVVYEEPFYMQYRGATNWYCEWDIYNSSSKL